MGLQRIVFRPTDSKGKKGDFEQVWKKLCETGSVCLDDPSAEPHNTALILKENPFALQDYTEG